MTSTLLAHAATAGAPRAGEQAGWTAAWPHDDLSYRCDEVTEFGAALRPLADLLCETRALRNGLAVAANQVGDRRRVFMWAWEGMDHLVVNPVLSALEGEQTDEEGCLSLNGVLCQVTRPARLHLAGQNIDGDPIEGVAEGLQAVIFAHEVDHLDGLVILDRLPTRQMRRTAERRWAKRRRALGLDA